MIVDGIETNDLCMLEQLAFKVIFRKELDGLKLQLGGLSRAEVAEFMQAEIGAPGKINTLVTRRDLLAEALHELSTNATS